MQTNAQGGAAYWLEGNELVCGAPQDVFPFLDGGKHIVSIVGGGGKTTLLYHLAACFAARGRRTAVITTTKMGCPDRFCETMDDCRARWAAGEYAVCGVRHENGKFSAPAPEVLGALLDEAQAVVAEADGARRHPCKIPGGHEPVILDESDVVIAVMGLDALGGAAQDVCHRLENAMALLGCTADHRITHQDMADILLSLDGNKKGVGSRAYYIVLNKCDDEARLHGGRAVLEELAARGHTRAAMTYFPPESRTGL